MHLALAVPVALSLLVAGCVVPGAPSTLAVRGPVANFHLDKTVLLPGETLHLDASASRAIAGQAIASYRWSFGDGGEAEGAERAQVEHAYAWPGKYVILLTVLDTHDPPLLGMQRWTVGVGDVRTLQGTVQAAPEGGAPQELRLPFPVGTGAEGLQVQLHVRSAGDDAAHVVATVHDAVGRAVLDQAADLLGNATTLELRLPSSKLAPSGAWSLVVQADQGTAQVDGTLTVRYAREG